MPFFSIIVPIHNTPEEYLRECIESSINQKTDDIEIILIDDGSDDYCGEICLEYAKRIPQINYIRQDNKGASVARNAGLMIATGEYIVFLDSDDVIPDGFLQTIRNKISEYGNPDILMYGYGSKYSNRVLNRLLPNEVRSKLERNNLIYATLGEYNGFLPYDVVNIWAKLIKRSVIEEHNIRFPIGVIRGQDAVFMLYVYNYCKTVSFIPMIGYFYRKNDRSISHRFNPQIVDMDENKFSKYEAFLNDMGFDADTVMSNIRVKALLGEYLNLYFCHRDNPKDRLTLKNEYIDLIKSPKYYEAIMNTSIDGILTRIKLNSLRKCKVSLVLALKTAEMKIRRVLIREYN